MPASRGGAVFKNQTLNGDKELCEFGAGKKARLKFLASKGHVARRATAQLAAVLVLQLHSSSCRGVTLEKESGSLVLGLYIWFG